MKLTTWILAGLMLVIGAADGLAFSPAVDALEGALRQRLEDMDTGGDLDKAGRKRRKAILKCLRKMGKTRADLKDDLGLLDEIAKKLGKRFADDAEVLAVVSSAAAAVWFRAATEIDGLDWKVEEGEAVTGRRRAKARRFLEQSRAYLDVAYDAGITNDETILVGFDRGAKAMSTGPKSDWTMVQTAIGNLSRAVKRFAKLRKWLGEQDCPGRPIGATESAALEYASCRGALVIAVRTNPDHVEATIRDGEARIMLAVCRPGEPELTVELRVRGGPQYPAGWETVHAADGSPSATAKVTLFLGPYAYPDHGREATGTVTIDSIDPASGRITGSFHVWNEIVPGDAECEADISGVFDLDVESDG